MNSIVREIDNEISSMDKTAKFLLVPTSSKKTLGGSTFIMTMIINSRGIVFNVGDCRAITVKTTNTIVKKITPMSTDFSVEADRSRLQQVTRENPRYLQDGETKVFNRRLFKPRVGNAVRLKELSGEKKGEIKKIQD